MSYIFNREKIKELLSDFYVSTGIAVTLYDSAMNMVATSPVHSEYCKYIRENKEGIKNCTLSNLTHMKEAAKTKKTVSYTCHAGLMETIMPVVYEDLIIGYMQIGQFRDENGFYSTIDKALSLTKNFCLDSNKSRSLYLGLPIVSEEKLQALNKILTILIKSFWDDSLIRHNRSMLSVKIEQYIDEHLKEKFYVDKLCEKFFLSKNALYRLFKNEFNISVAEYVINKRLALSIDMLKTTNLAVTTIANDCGFNDYNYFIRTFKKHVGVTPLQFRKNK
ncbi:MAG: PocR ligand-binding domain-containing protein [Clostridia bacterium]|nr:PocR ligand-binding domain-containing protein [Clostridia bacterium]